MKSVLEIKDGDEMQPLSVPDTDFVIHLESRPTGPHLDIRRDGAVEREITRRLIERFRGARVNAATLRRIASWLREGAPPLPADSAEAAFRYLDEQGIAKPQPMTPELRRGLDALHEAMKKEGGG